MNRFILFIGVRLVAIRDFLGRRLLRFFFKLMFAILIFILPIFIIVDFSYVPGGDGNIISCSWDANPVAAAQTMHAVASTQIAMAESTFTAAAQDQAEQTQTAFETAQAIVAAASPSPLPTPTPEPTSPAYMGNTEFVVKAIAGIIVEAVGETAEETPEPTAEATSGEESDKAICAMFESVWNSFNNGDDNQLAEAKTKFDEILQEHPGIKIPDQLKSLRETPSPDQLWLWAKNTGNTVGETLLVYYLIILIVIPFLWLVIRRIHQRAWRKFSLNIMDFSEGGTKLEGMGKEIPARIAAAWMQLAATKGSLAASLVDAADVDESKVNFPEIKFESASGIAKVLLSLLNWILQQTWFLAPNTLALSGEMHKSPTHGAGLTLALKGKNRVIAEDTLWQKDYEPGYAPPDDDNKKNPDAFYHLTTIAAIWVFFQLLKQQDRNEQTESFTLLGTNNWHSYAYFRMGQHWLQDGETGKAKQMYKKALQRDEKNRFALFSLAVIYTRDEKYKDAFALLKAAKQIVDKDDDSRGKNTELKWFKKLRGRAENKKSLQGDVTWYKITYQLAATTLYPKSSDEGAGSKGASKLAKELCDARKYTLCAIEKAINVNVTDSTEREVRLWWKRFKYRWSKRPINIGSQELEQLACFLRDLELVANVLKAIAEFVDDNKVDNSDWKQMSYRAQYNLACYYSRQGQGKKQQGNTKQAAEHYQKSLDCLEKSLRFDSALTKWAAKDPGLAGVREEGELAAGGKLPNDKEKSFKELFNERVAKHTYPPTPVPKSALSALSDVGEHYAAALKRYEIVKVEELIAEAKDPKSQQELAQKLGVAESLVRRWALLADLMNQVVLNAEEVNLLYEAGMESIKELSTRNPEHLWRLLAQINRARKLVEGRRLYEHKVYTWVEKAKKAKPEVK